MDDVVYSITSDPTKAISANQQLIASLQSIQTKMDQLTVASEHNAESVTAGLINYELLRKGLEEVTSFVKESIQAYEEQEAAIMRVTTAGNAAGIAFDQIREHAEALRTPLLDDADKYKIFADLINRGFSLEQIDKLVPAMENVAASTKNAGTTVAQSMEQMTEAFLRGKITSVDMVRAFPNLINAFKEAGLKLADLKGGMNQAAAEQVLYNEVLRQGQIDADGMAKYLGSVQGAFELLHVATQQAKEDFATGLISGLQDAIKTLGELAKTSIDVKAVMENLGHDIGVSISAGVHLVIASFDSLGAAFSALKLVWDQVKLAATGFGAAIEGMVISVLQSLQKMYEALHLQSAATAIAESIANITISQSKLLISNAQLLGEIQKDKSAIETGVVAANQEWNKALDDLTSPLTKVASTTDSVTAATKNSSAAFMDSKEAAKQAAEGLKAYQKGEEEYIKYVQGLWAQVTKMETENAKQLEENNKHAEAAVDKLGKTFTATAANAITLSQATGGLSDKLIAQKKATDDLINSLDKWAGIIGIISNAVGGLAGQGLGALSKGLGTASNLLKGFTDGTIQNMTGMSDKSAAAIGGMGVALTDLGQTMGGTAGAVLSGVGAIATGFATGGPWGAAIAAIGVMFNALVKLFQHNWQKDAEHMISAIYGIKGVSESVAKSIAEAAKTTPGGTDTATFLHIGDIANDVGVTTANLNQFIDAFNHGLGLMARGFIDAKQYADQLNQVFPQMLAAATDSFGLVNDQLKEMIANTKAAGVQVQAITDFINAQNQSLVDGLNKVLAAGINTKQEAVAAEQNLVNVFNSLIASGMSAQDAMSQLGGNIDTIIAAMKELGLQGTEAFKQIVQQQHFLEHNQATISALQGINQELVAMSNLGELTKGSFSNLQHEAENMFKKFMSDGKISNQELKAMAPTLALLQQLAQQYGFTLDATTQHLIDLATKHHLLKDSDAAPTLDQTMQHLDTTMTKLEPILERMAQTLGIAANNTTDLANAASQIQFPSAPNYSGIAGGSGGLGGGGGTKGIRQFDSLGAGSVSFSVPEVIKVDAGEKLYGSKAAMGVNVTIVVPPGVVRNEHELARFVGREFDKRVAQRNMG